MLIRKRKFEYKDYYITAHLVSIGKFKKIWIKTKSKNKKYKSHSSEKFADLKSFMLEMNELEKMESSANEILKESMKSEIKSI